MQSDDLGPGAQVKAPDVAAGAVGSTAVINESLTGADIKDQSGVDTCVNTVRIGQLCMRAENSHRPWYDAIQHCANIGLRVPTFAEALELATTHDMPNVDEDEPFWTQDRYFRETTRFADQVDDSGSIGFTTFDQALETVCVTNPTN